MPCRIQVEEKRLVPRPPGYIVPDGGDGGSCRGGQRWRSDARRSGGAGAAAGGGA